MPAYKLLALDIDGTLVGPEKVIRPAVTDAIQRAERAGIRPILCTGRRYRRALPIAEQLGLKGPIVCNSGALIKESTDHSTSWTAPVEPELVREILAILIDRGELAISIIDHGTDPPDFLVPARATGRELFDDYVTKNGSFALVDPEWMTQPGGRPHFHMFSVGDWDSMKEVEAAIHAAMPGLLRTFVLRTSVYAGTMCEVLSLGASKWAAVSQLAEGWGITPDEIVAVGDDVNDLPMIQGAGFGVAMGNAPDHVLEAADYITDHHHKDGVRTLIDDILLS